MKWKTRAQALHSSLCNFLNLTAKILPRFAAELFKYAGNMADLCQNVTFFNGTFNYFVLI